MEYCKYCGEFFRRVSSHIGYCRERIIKEAREKAELECELRLLKEKIQKEEKSNVYNITNNITTNNITITNINVAMSLRDTFDTFLEEMKDVIKNEEQENIINLAKSHPNQKVRNAIECLINFDKPFKEIDILCLKEKIDHNNLDKIETMYDAIKKATVKKMNEIAGRK